MGEAVLKKFPGIREIHLSLPNKHYNLIDLSAFHLENPKEIFLPTDEPQGLIEATLRND
jgi:urate oxidase